jgi:predicted DCC family thiol-disulfide oxidoreductase YuxK
MNRPVLLFDGVCNLCSRTVQFIIKKDKRKKFMFGSLQSRFGQEVLRKNKLSPSDFNSFILMVDGKLYTHSTGVLRTMKLLGGGWKLLYGLTIVPRFLRDRIYNWIASNRYRWFGKKEECWLPTEELKSRFIE